MCCSFNFQGRNIRPSDKAQVLVSGNVPMPLSFGLRLSDGRLILNARSETALEKPLFREAMNSGRIIIPADCFHEWDRHKMKHTFALPHGQTMFFAGLREKESFVILTTAANSSVLPVHGRMPLILEELLAQRWLSQDAACRELLGHVPPELHRRAGTQQGSLLHVLF